MRWLVPVQSAWRHRFRTLRATRCMALPPDAHCHRKQLCHKHFYEPQTAVASGSLTLCEAMALQGTKETCTSFQQARHPSPGNRPLSLQAPRLQSLK